jgi:HOMODA hydrolase
LSIWLDLFGAEVRYIDTPSFGRTRIIEAGRGKPQALVLLHGIGGHAEAYSKNVLPLAEHYHVVAFDAVGHGLSAKPTDIKYGMGDYAQQLGELMDALGIERAHLSGESLGGAISSYFANQYPARVQRLVLNTTAAIPIVTEQGHRDLENLAELSNRTTGKPASEETVRARIEWLIYKDNWHLITDELVQNRLAIYSREDYRRSAPLVFARLNQKKPAESGKHEGMIDLEALSCETLLFWTKHNPVHDVPAAEAALKRLRKGSLYVMKGEAAHWPQYEHPDEFNTVIHKFLETGKTQ